MPKRVTRLLHFVKEGSLKNVTDIVKGTEDELRFYLFI
jgi:hypothetical protein